MAIDARGVVARRKFRESRRGRRIVLAAAAGRLLVLARFGRLQQGETKFPFGGGNLLSLRRQRRNPAIGRIDNQRRARAGALHGHEHLVVGAGDVEPRSRAPHACRGRAAPIAARSNSARCASVKNSWFAYLAERCRGVSVSSVQMPCRSGSPQGVFSAGARRRAGSRRSLSRRPRDGHRNDGADSGPAMATVIIEPENLSRMMVSFALQLCDCDGIARKPRADVDGSILRQRVRMQG